MYVCVCYVPTNVYDFILNLFRKRLKERIRCIYPTLSHTLLDDLLPSKCNIASLRVSTHGSIKNVTIFTVNDEPLFFEYGEELSPTGKSVTGYCILDT